MNGGWPLASGALFVAVAAALGCSKPAPPTLVPVSAAVTQLTPVGLDLALTLNATNPNASDLSAQGVSAHVVLNRDLDLGTVSSSEAIVLPAGKTTTITVPLSVKWASLASVAALVQTTADVPYAVDGTVTMGGTLLNVGLPFHLDGRVTHAQLLDATLRSIPGLEGLPGLGR
jgi:LEA14-like dessication related protein